MNLRIIEHQKTTTPLEVVMRITSLKCHPSIKETETILRKLIRYNHRVYICGGLWTLILFHCYLTNVKLEGTGDQNKQLNLKCSHVTWLQKNTFSKRSFIREGKSLPRFLRSNSFTNESIYFCQGCSSLHLQKPELIQSSPAALILPFTAVLE